MNYKIIYFDSVGSTQAVVKESASSGATEGLVAVARVQEAGRGRMGRTWVSMSGGLYFSVLLRPSFDCPQILNLAAALSVSNAIEELFGVVTDIKWPNDVLYEGKKLCGILSESASCGGEITHVICGAGINTNLTASDLSEELREHVTTLFDILGEKISNDELLKKILENFGKYYQDISSGDAFKFSSFIDEYKNKCATIGMRVRLELGNGAVNAQAVSVDERGALIIRTDDGQERAVSSGEIVHLRFS